MNRYEDYNWIIPGKLAQGSAPEPGTSVRLEGFDVLVLTAIEYQPPASAFPGVHVMHVPLHDDYNVPVDRAMAAARQVARAVRAGRRVLVTCHAGLNRSGLVTALALWYLGPISGGAAATKVRTHRQMALVNPYFYEWLRQLPARGARTRARQSVYV